MARLDQYGQQRHQETACTSYLWMRRALLFILIVAFGLSSLTEAQPYEVQLTSLDGKQFKKQLLSIDNETLNFSKDQNADLMSYRELIFSTQAKIDYSSTEARVYLLDGSVIQGEKLLLKDRALLISLGSQELSIPVEQCLGLLNVPLKTPLKATALAKPDVSFIRMMELEELDADRLYIQNKGKLASLGGAVASIGESRLSFVFNGENREVKREKVYGVVFAHFLQASPSPLGKVKLTLTNGSELWLTDVSLKDAQLKGQLNGSEISLPSAMLATMKIYSDRVMFLSDIDPVNVSSNSFFTRQPGDPTWFKDRAANVNGSPNPIRLKGKAYTKGLCILSETKLRYRINGAYDELVASVGIDDETRGKGDCELVILVDGVEKFRQRFKGSDEKTHELKIAVTGAQQVEIQVGFGEDGEFGDHLSLGDVRFLKNKD